MSDVVAQLRYCAPPVMCIMIKPVVCIVIVCEHNTERYPRHRARGL
jgi:hypothetical protein